MIPYKILKLCTNCRNSNFSQYAADHGRFEICRYLLSQTTWPSHACILNSALSGLLYPFQASRLSAEFYRLFMGDPGFDADLYEDFRYGWLHGCHSDESLNVVLHSQFSGFDLHPLEYRFELASHLINISASSFLKCIGLPLTDQRLAFLRNVDGVTILHGVAHRIWALSHGIKTSTSRSCAVEMNAWLSIGISVLKHGADPCSIAQRPNNSWLSLVDREWAAQILETTGITWKMTPLMECLKLYGFGLRRSDRREFHNTLSAIGVWATMIAKAGLNLESYGSQETKIWISLGSQNPCALEYDELLIRRFTYGPSPTDWSLITSYQRAYEVYDLKSTPGQFPKASMLPKTIVWPPNDKEQEEGPWALVKIHKLMPNELDLRDSVNIDDWDTIDPICSGSQDDHGGIVLMTNRASWPSRIKPRSHSQPPCLRRRELVCAARYTGPIWLRNYHLCPSDFRWKPICSPVEDNHPKVEILKDNALWLLPNVRNCLRDISFLITSLQESDDWKYHSFLADIGRCQDRQSWIFRLRNPRAVMLRHTFDRNCPQGCGKVHLDRLNVPRALSNFHPKRIYRDDDE